MTKDNKHIGYMTTGHLKPKGSPKIKKQGTLTTNHLNQTQKDKPKGNTKSTKPKQKE